MKVEKPEYVIVDDTVILDLSIDEERIDYLTLLSEENDD